MIKVIKEGIKPAPNFHYRVTCSNCKTIFQCDSDDCFKKNVAHGFSAHAIRCPVCYKVCFDWQGGCDEWTVIKD